MIFSDLAAKGTISKATSDAIVKMGYLQMTEVQAATFPLLMSGKDCMARAMTGTGKTMAFLLPTVESLVKYGLPAKKSIAALILSPTRELAYQIETEAKSLLQFHPSFSVQCIVGGTNMKADLRLLNAQSPPTILVATPGRLLDHLNNHELASKLSGLKHLILDECDRLLDAGFKNDILKILAHLPDRRTAPRQALLFSATIGPEIREMSDRVLLKGHEFVSTVHDDDHGTHDHVEQLTCIVPMKDTLPTLFSLIKQETTANKSSKIIVFFPTARATQLAAELFNAMKVRVGEIHSRKSQNARTKASEAFRQDANGILFSSDVSARGLDFPGISLVIQAGVPMNKEQYVHRLGRTARAGEGGRGVLLLSEREQYFLRLISDLPILKYPTAIDISQERLSVNAGMLLVDKRTKSQAYAAHLGFYKTFLSKMQSTPAQLVVETNAYALEVLGCPEVPGLLRATVGKMGLKGVPGLRIVHSLDDGDDEPGTGSTQRGRPGQHQGQGAKRGGPRGGSSSRGSMKRKPAPQSK